MLQAKRLHHYQDMESRGLDSGDCSSAVRRLLILGGTSEAVSLAAQAVELACLRGARIANLSVITSLAGRTQQPLAVPGGLRVGGFGGEAGLVSYLREHRIDLLIDATHPFAAQMSWHAVAAAAVCGVPHLLLQRPAWQPVVGDRWIEVPTHAAAAAAIPNEARRVFLTIGRQELAAFAHLTHRWWLMRMIDPPAATAPVPPGEILLERGPFSLEHERSLLRHYKIDAVVSKNSGGAATYAKVVAARELGIPVVMVQRSPTPPAESVADVEGAIAWLHRQLGASRPPA